MALRRSSSPANDLLEPTTGTYADVIRGDQPHVSESFQFQVLALLGSLQTDMQSMGDRISKLEQTQSVPTDTPKGKDKGKKPAHGPGEEDEVDRGVDDDHHACRDDSEHLHSTSPPVTSRHWADRDNEVMDYDAVIVWDGEDEEVVESKGVKHFKVAEKTEKFLSNALWSPTLQDVNGATSMGHLTLWPLPAQILIR